MKLTVLTVVGLVKVDLVVLVPFAVDEVVGDLAVGVQRRLPLDAQLRTGQRRGPQIHRWVGRWSGQSIRNQKKTR